MRRSTARCAGVLVADDGRTLREMRASDRLGWDLATESIVVKIRWFGVVMGYVLVQTRTGLHDPSAVRAFLALGAGYAALDTVFSTGWARSSSSAGRCSSR